VKCKFSPDGEHVVSGSSDGKMFLWRASRPALPPVTLGGHRGEVTCVDWCAAAQEPKVGPRAR
jgi:denticleless